MASNFLGNPPRYDREKDLKKQVQELYDYLFQLRQGLEYALQNLSRENINPTELAQLEQRFRKLEQGLADLTKGAGT